MGFGLCLERGVIPLIPLGCGVKGDWVRFPLVVIVKAHFINLTLYISVFYAFSPPPSTRIPNGIDGMESGF